MSDQVLAPRRRPQLGEMLFNHFIQTVFDIVLNLFFSKMEILGRDNFPRYGPTIVVGNHNNQFADGILLTSKCYDLARDVRFIIAEKSWHRPIIGDLAKAIKCIPVARPQDSAKKGAGAVSGTEGNEMVRGSGTSFATDFKAGDTLKAGAGEYRVLEVISDSEMKVQAPGLKESLADMPYKIMKRMDQDAMYSRVYDLFLEGGLLGIFPEGGSHDRTEMLPLKAGVCIMALGAMQRYPQLDVKIVPCGLNYIAGHQFRSKTVLQFGPPIEITPELVQLYGTNKREAIATLLDMISRSIKDVVVEAPDYDALTVIHSLRKLYVPVGRRLTPGEYHVLNQRISKFYTDLQEDADFSSLQEEIKAYRAMLDDHMLTDQQVARMQLATITGRKRKSALLLVERIVKLIISSVVALPGMLFALPILFVGEKLAAQKAKEALAGSDVKIKALDVMASWKLITLMIMVPVMVVVYTAIFLTVLCLTTSLSWLWIVFWTALFAFSVPVYGNYCLHELDDIVRGIRTLKPLYLRATGAFQSTGSEVVLERTRLQHKVRKLIEKEGDKLMKGFQEVRLIKPEEFEREAELIRKAQEAAELHQDYDFE